MNVLSSLLPLLPSVLKILAVTLVVWVAWRIIKAYMSLTDISANGKYHS